MVSTDPIADMLSRIRNAVAVGKNEITLPHSRIKELVARILAENNFLYSVKVEESQPQKSLIIQINAANSSSRITEITRLSKPGRRSYVKTSEIPVIKRGRGIVVVSTSNGVMSGHDAKIKRLGGEIICRIY